MNKPRNDRNSKSAPQPPPKPAIRLLHASGQIIGRRERQEDSFANATIGKDLMVWVADGLGGHPRGDEASALAVEAAGQALKATFQRAERYPETPLQYAFARADQAVRTLHERRGYRALNAATTLVGGLVSTQQRCAFLSNIGDSLAYRYTEGELRLIFRPQGRGNIVDSALGFGRPGELEQTLKIQTVLLQPGNRLLLASDGIEGLDPDRLKLALTEATPDLACAAILDAVAARNLPHQDNATVVVVYIEPRTSARTPATDPLPQGDALELLLACRRQKQQLLEQGLLISEKEIDEQHLDLHRKLFNAGHHSVLSFDPVDERGRLYPTFLLEPGFSWDLHRHVNQLYELGAWETYRFMTSPREALKGRTPVEAVRDGDENAVAMQIRDYLWDRHV